MHLLALFAAIVSGNLTTSIRRGCLIRWVSFDTYIRIPVEVVSIMTPSGREIPLYLTISFLNITWHQVIDVEIVVIETVEFTVVPAP